jgi:hypothetical protein
VAHNTNQFLFVLSFDFCSSLLVLSLNSRSNIYCYCSSSMRTALTCTNTEGHYNVSAALGGLAGLTALVRELEVLGLKAGLHTMSGNIAYTDKYVSPVPDKRLAKSAIPCTLTTPLTPTSVAIECTQGVLPMPTAGALQIDDEIITFTGKTNNGFLGVTRGAYGTKNVAHSAAARTSLLLEGVGAFLPDPRTDLMDEIAGNIARVFRTADVSMLYFDGAEAMPGQYGESQMCRAFATHLSTDAIVESSTNSPFCWHLITRTGQSDWGAIAVRSYFDQIKTISMESARANMMAPDLGWAGIFEYSPGSWLATTPQELEFLASKAIGWGGAPSLEFAGGHDGTDGTLTTNGRAMEAMHRVGAWLKLNFSLPEAIKVLLRQPNLDHEIFRDNSTTDDPSHPGAAARALREAQNYTRAHPACRDRVGGNAPPKWWITPVKVHEPFVADPQVRRLNHITLLKQL